MTQTLTGPGWTLHQADYRDTLRAVADAGGSPDQRLVDVGVGVNPSVTRLAKGHDVVEIQPQARVFRPALDVVEAEVALSAAGLSAVSRPAPLTLVLVASEHGAVDLGPLCAGVDGLSLGRAASLEVVMKDTLAAEHRVPGAAQRRVGAGSRRDALLSGFLRVLPTPARRDVRRVAVSGDPAPLGPARDTKLNKLVVDVRWIAPDDHADGVGRKALDFVLLPQPIRIKVGRLHV